MHRQLKRKKLDLNECNLLGGPDVKKITGHCEKEVIRCDWVSKDHLYIEYHDNEWGQPQFDSVSLFEMLCLGGQQAGLSWITILKKRNHYRKLFHNFNPRKVSELDKSDIEKIMCDPGIIRNRSKLEAIVHNSKCYMKMEDDGIEFSKFIWSFVDNTPIVNSWKSFKDAPAQTDASHALSSALKKKGFKFVGSTICYAFMQTCGLINDHIISCFCYGGSKNNI